MLGDVQIAEPNALICFAGPRVIEQTIRERLPEGFQRSEYLLDHGMLDKVVSRKFLREELIKLIYLLKNQPPPIRGNITSLMGLMDEILKKAGITHPKIIDLKLDRVKRLLRKLGNPEKSIPPVIHVAGTNGKGSTIAMIKSGLQRSGLRHIPILHHIW